MKAIIVSDDLTGAADCAAALWPRAQTIGWIHGVPRARALDARDLRAAGAIALDLELRPLDPQAASRRLRSCLESIRPLLGGDRHLLVYLKIDSALRGHIALSVGVAADVFGVPAIPVVPANPLAGRTTASGCQYVDGQPVHESTFARDPHDPVRTASIVDALCSAGLDATCGTTADFASWTKSSRRRTAAVRVFVPDVANEVDLGHVGDAIGAAGIRVVCAAAGLSSHLGIKRELPEPDTEPPLARHAWRLVVVGSAHAMAHRQVEVLERDLGQRAIAIDPGRSFDVLAAVRGLRARGWAILIGPGESEAVPRAEDTACALAIAAKELDSASAGRIEGAIVVGGETAYHVFRQLGIPGFRTVGCVESGMPVVTSIEEAPRRLALKPGSSGDAETLVRAARELERS